MRAGAMRPVLTRHLPSAAHLGAVAIRTRGVMMPVEMLTYAALAERLGSSSEAARALVKRLRLPRQRGNNGKALVAVDLAEINHTPTLRAVTRRSPDDHQAVVATLKARVETLEAELARLETAAAGHRADFERERERCDRLMACGLSCCCYSRHSAAAPPGQHRRRNRLMRERYANSRPRRAPVHRRREAMPILTSA